MPPSVECWLTYTRSYMRVSLVGRPPGSCIVSAPQVGAARAIKSAAVHRSTRKRLSAGFMLYLLNDVLAQVYLFVREVREFVLSGRFVMENLESCSRRG